MSIGSSNNVFKATSLGIQLGHANWLNAPFRVDMAGNAFAYTMTLSSPDIQYGSIKGTSIDIGSGNFKVDSAGNMVANSASITGSINSGSTIIGAVIRTSSGNERMQLDSGYLSQFDSSNKLLLQLGTNGSPYLAMNASGGYLGASSAIFTSLAGLSIDSAINPVKMPIRINAGSEVVNIFGSSILLNTVNVLSVLGGKTNSGSSTSSNTVADNHNHGFTTSDYIQCYDAAGVPTSKKQWVPYAGSAAHSHTTT